MSTTAGHTPSRDERQTKMEGRQQINGAHGETHNLAVRYGKIGIPAVAAALRYCDAGKNPAYAPVVPRNDHRLIEMAA